METNKTRLVYLDNIRNFLVYNVVLYHAVLAFACPLVFWWPVVDKASSSRFYETVMLAMDVYMMPCLMFIAAIFIFPSLKKEGALQYLKNRFLRLYVPVIVFVFCASDIWFQFLLKRLNSVSPTYLDTFINFWRSFVNMPALYLTGSEKTLNTVFFNFNHTWFLALLFFMTLVIVLLSLLFKSKTSEQPKVDSREEIIPQTFAVIMLLTVVYTGALILYTQSGINHAWAIIGKAVQFEIYQIWILIPMFIFGLYAYKKEWLTSGNIGGWKLWGGWAAVFLGVFVLLVHSVCLPVVDQICKVLENKLLSDGKMVMPIFDERFKFAMLCTWVCLPIACVSLLMFFLSFAKRFFNKPNEITAFCSKHSINVYILHPIPLFILQDTSMNVPIAASVKIILMTIIVISACLWLSHRLAYPYPKIAIAFFVALKLISLAVGFTFYYWAILALIFISFAGAIYETGTFLFARKASLEPALCIVEQNVDGKIHERFDR